MKRRTLSVLLALGPLLTLLPATALAADSALTRADLEVHMTRPPAACRIWSAGRSR